MTESIVFIETNSTGTGTECITKARKRGFHTVLFTGEQEFYSTLVPNPCEVVDEVVPVNTFDIGQVMSELKSFSPRAVLAFDEYRLYTASLAASLLGLPHADPDAVLTAKFKHLMRNATRNATGHVPYKVLDIADMSSAAEACPDWPVVIKPSDDSASVGVRLCKNGCEYSDGINHLLTSRVNKRGYLRSSKVLVEEFVSGPEFSCELLFDTARRRWAVVGFTKKVVTPPPFFVEVAHIFPYEFEEGIKEVVEEAILQWLSALKLDCAAAHIEFKIRDGKPYLIEVNPRLPGGGIATLVQRTMGLDLVDAYLRFHIGEIVEAQDTWKADGRYGMVLFGFSELLDPGSASWERFFAALRSFKARIVAGHDRLNSNHDRGPASIIIRSGQSEYRDVLELFSAIPAIDAAR